MELSGVAAQPTSSVQGINAPKQTPDANIPAHMIVPLWNGIAASRKRPEARPAKRMYFTGEMGANASVRREIITPKNISERDRLPRLLPRVMDT